jgi:4-amino-4-deoxy-L-arabinose transferase-like glycosyltransferase
MRAVSVRRPAAAFLLVLGVACAVRVANLRWMAAQPFSAFQFVWMDSDMATHWEWAGRIVRGDLLTRDPYQPYPPWMQDIAPLETWNRWHGEHVFNKAPLYPYLLAGMRALVGDDYFRIGLCQVALGVLNVALVFLLTLRYFDVATATTAGLGAALYGPPLLYETLLLRDPLAVTVSLLLLLALSRCTTAAPGRWLLAGVAFAVALLGRELVAPFAALVVVWAWQQFRRRRGELWRALGAFAAGTLLGLLPLITRNIAVGASPLALSAIGVEGIIYGHAVGTEPAHLEVPPATAQILQASDGRLFETIRGTLATYGGDWGQLLRNEALRTAAIFSGLEGSDNVSWYYFVDRSWLLAYALRYELVLGLGLVGVWLARRRVRGDDRIVLYYLGLSMAALQFVPVIGRYRLVPATILIVYGAVTVVAIGRAVRDRRWRAAVGPAAASAAIAFVSARLLLVPGVAEWCRANDYLNDAHRALVKQDGPGIYDALRSCVDCITRHADSTVMMPHYGLFVQDLLVLAGQLDRRADAVGVLERLAAAYPSDRAVARLLLQARAPGGPGAP